MKSPGDLLPFPFTLPRCYLIRFISLSLTSRPLGCSFHRYSTFTHAPESLSDQDRCFSSIRQPDRGHQHQNRSRNHLGCRFDNRDSARIHVPQVFWYSTTGQREPRSKCEGIKFFYLLSFLFRNTFAHYYS